MDPDPARLNVWPDLVSNCLTLLIVFSTEFIKEVDFEKNQQATKKYGKLPSRQRFNISLTQHKYKCKLLFGRYGVTGKYFEHMTWNVAVTIINPSPAELINARYPFLKTWSIKLDNLIN